MVMTSLLGLTSVAPRAFRKAPGKGRLVEGEQNHTWGHCEPLNSVASIKVLAEYLCRGNVAYVARGSNREKVDQSTGS